MYFIKIEDIFSTAQTAQLAQQQPKFVCVFIVLANYLGYISLLFIDFEDDSTQQLYLAASTGQTEKFEKLFEAADEKNPCNAEGYTPFLLAARKGHFQICDFALQKVKDLNIDLGKNFLMLRQFQDRPGRM